MQLVLLRADCSNADRPGAIPQHNGLTAFGKVRVVVVVLELLVMVVEEMLVLVVVVVVVVVELLVMEAERWRGKKWTAMSRVMRTV